MLKLHIESHNNRNGTASINFEGTEKEIRALKNALTNGTNWVRINKRGTLIKVPAFKVPEVLDDDAISPYFKHIKQIISYFANTSIRRLAKTHDHPNDPSYFVQHITGYGGDYKERKVSMEAVGFECLRSRRGKDGKYWEIWYLPGVWAATGELEGKAHKEIMAYLCQVVNPGQITVSGERWGLGVD